jgi:chromosome segregation ATPase
MVFLKIAFVSYSQGTKDTLCFSIEDVKKNVSNKQALEADIAVYKDDVRILNEQKANLQQQIANLMKADSIDQKHIAILESQVAVYDKVIKSYEDQIVAMTKEIKRWRRKNFWTTVGGIVATTAALFLYFTK